MDKATDHHCPGCGTALKHNPRYPWYFCNDCRKEAADCEGRRIVFGNASVSGGLSWAYADEPEKRDDTALRVVCLIRGRPAIVSEARFGGVVAQPVADDCRLPDGARRPVDLTRPHHLDEARKRLA